MSLTTLKPRLAETSLRLGSSRVPGAWGKTTARQGNTTERGYGWAWQQKRAAVLLRDCYLCQICQQLGRTTAATEVDHIVNRAQRGSDEDSNLQSLCTTCHGMKTAYENVGGRHGQALPEWLPRPIIPTTVVVGPPGSGKSTHVAQRKTPHDLVLDLDEIAARMTGKSLFHATAEEAFAALRVRNSLLAALSRAGLHWRAAWLIVTAGSADERSFWQRKVGPVTVLPHDVEACVARIEADTRRPAEAKARAIAAARVWR